MVENCIHISNGCYLVSFLTRDMLWLRVLTSMGLALGLVFFSCQPTPMYGPTAWHIIFLFINGIQIYRLVKERERLRLSREREKLAQAAFKDLSRDEMLNLLTRAMCAQADHLPDLSEAARLPLSPDEQVVRDIAFRGLTRADLLNLLTRRLWRSLRWVNPARWRFRWGAAQNIEAPSTLAGEPKS